MFKVWLRLASQSDDEAIKLVFPSDSDVSDVLVRAPTVVNVGQLRPSELTLHFMPLPVKGGEDSSSPALSNRLSLLSLSEEIGSDVLTFVVKPKASTSSIMTVPLLPTTEVRKLSAPSHSGGQSLVRSKSPTAAAIGTGPSGRQSSSSPFRRTASATVVSSATGAKSSGSVRAPSPRAPSPRGSSAARQSIEPLPSNRPPLPSNVAINVAPARHSSPLRRASTVMKTEGVHQAKPTPRNSTGAVATQRHSAVAVPTQHPVAVPQVCAMFKPQWGNSLCATCKHSRQQHLMKQREHSRLPRNEAHGALGHVDPAVPLLAAASTTNIVSSENSMLTSPLPAEVGVSGGRKTRRRRPADEEESLLDPPSLSNVSIGSPSFDMLPTVSGDLS